MMKVSLLLAGGMKQEKAEKAMNALREGLMQKEIEAEIAFANLFETSDLSKYEAQCQLAVHAGTGALNINLPVVQGLGLLYPWMGTDELYEEIEKLVKEK